MAKPSLHTAGSWAEDTSGSLTATLPTHSTGDMLIVRVGCKSSAIATLDISTATAGWQKVGEFHNGTNNSGNGTGSVAVAAFWKVATSASETAPTIDFSQTQTQAVHVSMAYTIGSGDTVWSTPVGDGGGDTSSGTSHSATIQSHVSITANDLVDFFSVQADDTTQTVPTFTQTGATLDAVVESPAAAGAFTGGADCAADGGYRTVASGTSSAAAVVTGTLSTSETGSSWTTRLRSFAPETHSGTVTGTGGGVAVTTARKAAATSLIATAGGVAVLAGRKAALRTIAGTGGGIATPAQTTNRVRAETATGGGTATLSQTTARAATIAATGSGIATITYQIAETHFGSLAATGGGIAVLQATTDRPATLSATGAGIATVTQTTGRATTVSATGGGVGTVTSAAERAGSVSATGGGTASLSVTSARFLAALMSGGGVMTELHSTERFAAISGTGGGIATVTGTSGSGATGSVTATGGGVAVIAIATARAASVTATGAGAGAIAGIGGHRGTVTATGGGIATLTIATEQPQLLLPDIIGATITARSYTGTISNRPSSGASAGHTYGGTITPRPTITGEVTI